LTKMKARSGLGVSFLFALKSKSRLNLLSQMNKRNHEIDWKSLEHAYGSAEDVPYLLSDLKSEDAEVRSEAYHELFGNIWHQGTIYSATSHVVPFLFELFDSPHTQDKDMLIALIANIASGQGYYQVHQPLFEQWDTNVNNHETELEQEANVVRTVRDAISPRFLTLLKELANEEPEVRRAVAEATIFYPEYFETSLLKLKEILKTETDEEVKEIIEESISQIENFNPPPTPR
jgi:hypothetical protein